MKKSFKVMLVALGVLIALFVAVLIYHTVFKKEENVNVQKEIKESIEGYSYTYDSFDSDVFKEEFLNLKRILESEEIDEIAYATSLAKLFAIDLYTIETKLNKSDVGGVEYIYSTVVETYKLKMIDTLYKEVKDNSNENREQELPYVISVTAKEPVESSYDLGNSKVDSYEVEVEISYEENLGYDKVINVIMVKENNKLSVVEFEPVSEA